VAGLLALAAPLALALAAPPSYEPADLVPIGAIVAFSILPYATTSAFFHLVFLSGTTRVMAVAAPLAAAVNLGLNFLLLPVIGLVGSAVATVLAYGLLAAIAYTAARRRGPVGRLPLDALRCWAVAAPFVAAGALLPGGVAGSMGRALAAGALVGLAAYWLREAPRPWPWLRARLRRGERVAWTAR
jgi:O-antigen/teichoic acid export membrane protein